MQTIGGPPSLCGSGWAINLGTKGTAEENWTVKMLVRLPFFWGLESLCRLHLEIWNSENHSLNQNILKIPLSGRKLSSVFCQLFLQTRPSGVISAESLGDSCYSFWEEIILRKIVNIEICLCEFT